MNERTNSAEDSKATTGKHNFVSPKKGFVKPDNLKVCFIATSFALLSTLVLKQDNILFYDLNEFRINYTHSTVWNHLYLPLLH